MIVEIRGAEGGEEANLFARDLYEMYQRYAALRGLRLEVLEERPSERDGLDEVVFKVDGRRRVDAPRARGGHPPRPARAR